MHKREVGRDKIVVEYSHKSGEASTVSYLNHKLLSPNTAVGGLILDTNAAATVSVSLGKDYSIC
jgi:hypothetical protein